MKTHKDLDVWKLGNELALIIYRITAKFPKSEQFGLVSQMRRAVVSIPSNIAEGAARGSRKEYIRYNYIALGSLSELETQLMLANELGYNVEPDIFERVEKLRRKLLNFIKHLKNASTLPRFYAFTLILLAMLLSAAIPSNAQSPLKIAKLKYSGGGDWYSNKTALPNLIDYCNQQLRTNLAVEEDVVEVGSTDIFLYPYVYMTGHGNVVFRENEAENLRNYLMAGGFLHIDDNYGLDQFIRLEMKRVFPELDFVELPFDHPIYHQKFKFPEGLPKIHEHDGKPAQGFGLIYEGRLVCFYSYESDLGNGWEDQSIHNDPPAVRLKALKMGANLISYCFSN